MDKLRKRKGVSPVIATVILVAVTITVAVAVAYWMSGIASQYTSFEKIEIQTAICTGDATTGWTIVVTLKNSGTKTATLTDVFVNEEAAAYQSPLPTPLTLLIAADVGSATGQTKSIDSGATETVNVGLFGGTLSSGTTINIKIHSASGMDYIKLLQLT